ncbi:MAG: hypothetical protein PWP04_1188 [Candidatus Atribacteria bacterium]|nr:hypothetical protein [Candidatus Atribacteria bacterium]
MNSKEKFKEIMQFNKKCPSLKWEFGYWGETINRWYEEGLPNKDYPRLPNRVTSVTSHLYSAAWNSIKSDKLPSGIAVTGGGLYWPTQGFPLDTDVRDYFAMDRGQILINVNLLFYPMFEVEILEEDEKNLIYKDLDGVKRHFLKETAVLPSGIEYPIKDRRTWNELKERLDPKNVEGRLPPNWDELLVLYKDRNFPLALGGYPHGLFGTLATLMGYDKLFINYYDDPSLIHDVNSTFTELWISVYSEVLKDVEIDVVHIWEDLSFGKGPMISPAIIKEFMIPYYKKLTDFLKSKGVDVILLDTDGYCFDIIPLFIEGGITGIYPIEVSCGMDLVEVRKSFPQLQIMGGIPKGELKYGQDRIDQILKPVEEVIKEGGYIPFADHLVPPDVNFENFAYYRNKLNQIIDSVG